MFANYDKCKHVLIKVLVLLFLPLGYNLKCTQCMTIIFLVRFVFN